MGQSRNEDILQSIVDATQYTDPPKSRVEDLLLQVKEAIEEGGGGGGTSNYNDLSNKPQIGGTTLTGNKSASDLGLVAAETGKGLSTNDYTNEDKAIVGGVTAALAGKQDALTAGKYIDIDANNEISVEREIPNEAFTYTIKQIDDYSLEIIKTVNDAVVFDEVYSCYDPVAQQQIDVNETFDDAINIHIYPAGERSYTLLIASDAHEAGFKQTTPWWQRNTFVENFSTVDHSGEKLIIKSELDAEVNAIKDGQSIDSFADVETALSGKQATLTFDDAPTDNSNNPVKSNGIYDALATKQNATDNSLQTTDKTVVGAINEHEGDIDSLKSGLTNVAGDVKLNTQDLTTPSRSKNVINILDKASETINGVTAVCSGGVITLTGEISGDAEFYFSLGTPLVLDPALYKIAFNNTATNQYMSIRFRSGTTTLLNYAPNVANRVIDNWPDSVTCDRLSIAIPNGYFTEMSISITVLAKAETNTTYTPYIPSVESRIEAVESGVTELDTKMQRYGKVSFSANKWYNIGYIEKSSLGWSDRHFIIAFSGALIKDVRLRCNPTEGYNNTETSITQIYGTANRLGLKVSEDNLRIDIYIAQGYAGNQIYQILTEAGETPSVTFIQPVITDLTDADMTKVG